ncbi:MAG: hypothetical protein ABI779_06775 [Acidobacteriota bacterium]
MMRRTASVVGCLTLLATLAGCRPREQPVVTIATTPELAGMGVASMLADTFTAETKVRTNVLVTDARLIPDLVRGGVADVVITTSPGLNRRLQDAKLIRLVQTIASDDYLLVGPKRDPARTKDAKTAAEAFRRIARKDRAFCAPVDLPEFREREAQLWNASPAEPSDDRRYRSCHGTAIEVLREASRRGAYTLTDRATFENARAEIDLVPLLQRTPLLRNGVIVLLAGKRESRDAQWFVEWVMSYRGREAVERFRFDGDRRLFIGER